MKMYKNFERYKAINFLNLAIIISIMSSLAAYAQKDTTHSVSVFKIIGQDFSSGVSDAKYLLMDLVNPGIGHILYPAIALSSTYVASQFDERIRYPERSRYSDKILKQAGEPLTAIVLPSAIYITGLIFEDTEVRTTGRLLFESICLAGATNGIMKFALGRARPYMNLGNNRFEYFELGNDYQSLPSGHTTVAFTCASLLSARINNIYASIALYGIACGTAYERIRSDNHWFSDVVLGAGIGIFSSYSVLNAERNSNEKISDQNNAIKLSFQPEINSQYSGINMRIQW